MWFICRMLRIAFVNKIKNEVLARTGTMTSLVNKARKRQAVLFGHMMRKGLEHSVTTGKIKRTKKQGQTER